MSENVLSNLSVADWQGLYDHLGTIPYAPGTWSHNWRRVCSEMLANPGLLPDEEGYTPGYPWPGTTDA